MFVRMTPLDAARDVRALHPVTPIDNEGCAWFAVLAPYKPVNPDTVGDRDVREARADTALEIRTGGMRLYTLNGYTVAETTYSRCVLARNTLDYKGQDVAIGVCFPCVDVMRFACLA